MKNVLVITYWEFNDALIQTYTLPYVRIITQYLPAGSKVYLVTQEKDHTILEGERAAKIHSSLPANIAWVPLKYHRFGARAAFNWISDLAMLARFIFRKKISFIHAWATPAGAIGYLLSIVTSRKLIIDSYEPHAEAMVENGTWKKDSMAFKILFWLEKLQTRRATWLISATEGMRDYAIKKYDHEPTNFLVKPACVNLELFSKEDIKSPDLLQSLNLEGKVVALYAGKFGGIYLAQEVFELIKAAQNFWGDRLRVLLLTSHSREEIDRYAGQSGVDKSIIIVKFVPHASIPAYMGLADFALTPVRPVPTKRYCTPIKDGEYWALGLPVIISHDISDDSGIIQGNNAGVVIQSYDAAGCRQAIVSIDRLLNEPAGQRFDRIRSLAQEFRNFSVAHTAYRRVYSDDFK